MGPAYMKEGGREGGEGRTSDGSKLEADETLGCVGHAHT